MSVEFWCPRHGVVIGRMEGECPKCAARANAIRAAWIADEPGQPARLAWTDGEGGYFTRDLTPEMLARLAAAAATVLARRLREGAA